MPTPVVQEQYYPGTQKFTFAPVGGNLYTMISNPISYDPSPASMAQIDIPANVGASMLNGGVEYAPMALPLEWPEMDWSEYQYLATIQAPTFCKMIDHVDQGYWGWLKLGNFKWIAGIGAMKGSCKAVFLVSQPADGQQSMVNVIQSPTSVGTSTSAGGSIASSTVTYYWLTFFSPWGETTPYLFSVNTGATNNAYNLITWTPPYTGFYRSARLYASAASDGSQPIYIMGDVLAGQTQQWTDTTGINGLVNIASPPTVNRAAIGQFGGGTWINMQ